MTSFTSSQPTSAAAPSPCSAPISSEEKEELVSSRSRPTVGSTIPAATPSAGPRPATRSCSARPASPTSTSPTGCTGCSTSPHSTTASAPLSSSAPQNLWKVSDKCKNCDQKL